MASISQSDSQPIRIPRPSREKAQLFGYILRSGWILDFGRKRNVDPQDVKDEFNLIMDSVELIRAELMKDGDFASVWYLSYGQPDEVAQIYVASNFSRQRGMTHALIRANVEKLKKFLGTTDEPRWMNL
ncbi:hypothetical protein EV363DRAFT_1584446 [Boletus edulis]|uniref:Uncharacterized protein n=1 Tax=Boletus edulis BED1 TaxID=1328754 RepID=A0AAD4G6K9_BOLED|nr:hypothetical protein EV363DRAFT_1584446 [Boletus edulis]KAF8421340.1 hypothetical protein L210DRAFT_3766140 [Boletus edulis BED1]